MSQDPNKWYSKTYVFVIAFLCVGPLALPLVWVNPRYNSRKKAVITVITLIISYLVFVSVSKSLNSIYNYYNQILQLK